MFLPKSKKIQEVVEDKERDRGDGSPAEEETGTSSVEEAGIDTETGRAVRRGPPEGGGRRGTPRGGAAAVVRRRRRHRRLGRAEEGVTETMAAMPTRNTAIRPAARGREDGESRRAGESGLPIRICLSFIGGQQRWDHPILSSDRRSMGVVSFSPKKESPSFAQIHR